MTNITTTPPLSVRRIGIRHLRLPHIGIAASLSEFLMFLGDAYSSVYAAPFSCLRRSPQVFVDDDLDGRDPSW